MNFFQNKTLNDPNSYRPQTSNGLPKKPSISFVFYFFLLVNQGGIPTGTYKFMCQNWVPDSQNTNHYQQQQTRAGSNGIGMRSNRWTTTA